ncbi:hypothetical protein GGI35DRAFT_344959 [Trichoderma velutinum]
MIRLFACVNRHLQPLFPASLSLLTSPVLARRQVKCLASASTTLNRYSRHTRQKTVYSNKQMNSNPSVLIPNATIRSPYKGLVGQERPRQNE